MPTNSAALARARKASVAGRRSLAAAPRESEAIRSSIAVEPSPDPVAVQPTRDSVAVQPAAVAEDGTSLIKKQEVPQEGGSQAPTTTRNTAAVARARRSTMAGRQRMSVADSRRSVQIAQLPPVELPEIVAAPLEMVRRMSSAIVEATTNAIENMAAQSERVASFCELVSPREPEPVITGALLVYKGWGSWVAYGCTLQKIAPYGSDPEHRQLGCKTWTFCYRKIETKEIEIGGDEGPQSPGKDEKADVLNIFHHQLAEVSVVKRKKFEFSIRTHYDEFDPMDKPEELLKLRAKTQDEFEAWVDALSTWSQGVNSMSLLTF